MRDERTPKDVCGKATSATTLCWILCNSARVVATFKGDSFDGRPHLNFFYGIFTLTFFVLGKEKQCEKYD